MIPQDVVQQKKRIYRAVYGLMTTVIIILLIILIAFQFQYIENYRRTKISNNYHLAISNVGLEILVSIDQLKLWFRENPERSLAKKLQVTDLLGFAAIYEIEAKQYEIDLFAKQIAAIHDEFGDNNFDGVAFTFAEVVVQVQSGLDQLSKNDLISYEEIDDVVEPLLSITHQLQLLHRNAYHEMALSINDFQRNNQLRILSLIIALTFIGVASVMSILRHVGTTLTELTLTQKELAESEAKYRSMIETSSELIWSLDPEGRFTYLNPVWEVTLGFPVNEMIGKFFTDYMRSTEIDTALDHIKDITESGKEAEFESNYLTKSGSIKLFKFRALPLLDDSGMIVGAHGMGTDITEQREAEEAIERMASIAKYSSDFIGVADLEGHALFLNDAGRKLVGITDEAMFSSTTMADYFPEEGQLKLGTEILPELMDSGHWAGDIKFRHFVTGEEIPVYFDIFRIDHPTTGDPVSFATVTRDIRERIKSDIALGESRRLLELAQELAHVGHWDWDIRTNELTWSDEIYRIFGLPPQDFTPTYPAFVEMVHPDDRENVVEAVDAALKGAEYSIDHRIIWKNGELRYVQQVGTVSNSTAGEPIRMIGIIQDVTDRKRAETELILRSEIIQNMSEGVFLIGTEDGIIKYANPKFEEMFGYARDEMIGQNVSDVNAPPVLSPAERVDDFMEILMATGEWHGEVHNLKKDGTTFWCYANVSILDHPEYGNVLVSVHTDITERKEAEIAIRESESKFRSLAENSQDYIMRYDIEGRHLYQNPAAYQVADLTEADIIGKTHREAGFDEELSASWEKKIATVFETHQPSQTVFEWKVNEKTIYLDWRLFPEMTIDNKVKSVWGISRDITDMKEAENKIISSLDEKEVLLKEIHHRVKNNLQIVSSLLHLQTETVGDPTAIGVLEESRSRVHAMALLHENIYNTTDLAAIDTNDYVNRLTSFLSQTYDGSGKRISIVTDVDNVQLNMDTAIPLGLIINELVSNAFKYAYPTEKGGDRIILTELKLISETKARLRVKDDGIGLPDGYDAKGSLGMELVQSLKNQIDGELEILNNHGTEFRLEFSTQPLGEEYA